jgi:uncharacterized protein
MRSTQKGVRKMVGKYEVYKDKSGKYRWRLIHANGRVVAKSGESFSSREKALRGIWGTLSIMNSR